MTCYIGVDIGGTKIAAGVVDEGGRVLDVMQSPTPRTGAAAVLDAAIALCESLRMSNDVEAVGVGAAGQIDPVAGRVVFANPNLPGWTGAEIVGTMRRALGLPVYADNDVNVIAYSESVLGAGRDADHILYVTVGTGIGGAIVIDGETWHGASNLAGEIGYLYAGQGVTVEQMTAGPGIAAAYNAQMNKDSKLTLREIAVLAAQGDVVALDVIRSRATLFGEILAPFVIALDPQMLIVGGGVVQTGDLWWQPFIEAITNNPARPKTKLVIRKAALSTDAGLIGAAMMAKQRKQNDETS